MKSHDSQEIFQHVVSRRSVVRGSVGGTITIFFSQSATFVLNLVLLAFLARIFEPELFGLITMIMATANFAFIFRDLGLSMATIQRGSITHAQVSSLFWINTGLGALIMVLLMVASSSIAALYKEPRLIKLTIVISIAFLFSGMTVQHQALLKRRMHFGRLAIVEVLSVLLGGAIAMVLAFLGAGIWALVMAQVGRYFFMMIGCFAVLPWWPSLPKKTTSVRDLVRFGVDLAGFGVVNYLARNLDKVLIGRLFGAGPLAFYSKAYELLLFPITRLRGPFLGVASPALSGLQQDDMRYRDYLMKLSEILAFASFPLVGFLVLSAPELIRILLGDQWSPAAETFRRFGLAACVQPFGPVLGILLISLGRSRKYLIWGIAHSFCMVLSFIVGIPWGINGIATSYGIANVLIFVPSVFYCTNGTPINPTNFLRLLIFPLFAASVACFCVLFVNDMMPRQGDLTRLLRNAPCFLCTYLVPYFLFSNKRTEIIELVRHGFRILASRKPAKEMSA